MEVGGHDQNYPDVRVCLSDHPDRLITFSVGRKGSCTHTHTHTHTHTLHTQYTHSHGMSAYGVFFVHPPPSILLGFLFSVMIGRLLWLCLTHNNLGGDISNCAVSAGNCIPDFSTLRMHTQRWGLYSNSDVLSLSFCPWMLSYFCCIYLGWTINTDSFLFIKIDSQIERLFIFQYINIICYIYNIILFMHFRDFNDLRLSGFLTVGSSVKFALLFLVLTKKFSYY